MSSRLTRYQSGPIHFYRLTHPITGKSERVPSVSGIKTTLHQFQNDKWRVEQVADAIDAHWETLDVMAPTARRDAIVTQGLAQLNSAADFGRAVHHYCEQLWTGQPVDVPQQYAGYVESVARWWDASGVELVAAEALCYADSDELKGGAIAGTLDLLVEHPTRGIGLLDIKTWRPQASGTPRQAEWAFQLVAYADMDFLVRDDVDNPFPRTRWWGVLHVGPGGGQGLHSRRQKLSAGTGSSAHSTRTEGLTETDNGGARLMSKRKSGRVKALRAVKRRQRDVLIEGMFRATLDDVTLREERTGSGKQ